MTKVIIISCILFSISTNYAQKLKDGIFITSKQRQLCDHNLGMLNKDTSVCLLQNPIINTSEFESLSAIRNTNNRVVKVFNLYLSNEGKKKLEILTDKFRGSYIALVLDEEVISIGYLSEKVSTGIIIIGDRLSPDQRRQVYRKLKEIIDS